VTSSVVVTRYGVPNSGLCPANFLWISQLSVNKMAFWLEILPNFKSAGVF